MLSKKPSTPRVQSSISSFLESKTKKRSPPKRLNSPTNQTSSPDQKKASVQSIPNTPEVTSNESNPKLITPQRDKSQGLRVASTQISPQKDEEGDTVMLDSEMKLDNTQCTEIQGQGTGEQGENLNSQPEITRQGEDEPGAIATQTTAPALKDDEVKDTATIRDPNTTGQDTLDTDVGIDRDNTQSNRKTNPTEPMEKDSPSDENPTPVEISAEAVNGNNLNELTTSPTTDRGINTSSSTGQKVQIKLKPSLKNSYAGIADLASHLPPPAPIIPRWKTHRFACMFDIDMPKDRSQRTELLSAEVNKMLICTREYTKVYVRKYSDFHMPRDSDRKTWISKFDKKKVSDLMTFTFGFYFYQQLREGTFRLLIQLVLPINTNIPELIMNVNGHKWAGKRNRSLRDIREQNLHSPKYVGWLFRSNYSMVGSNDLQDAFDKRAGMHFGLTYKSVPVANQGKYNKDTAIKAICISCNEEDQETAWNTLMTWYNSKRPAFPLGIPMMFIPSKDHPDIRNNPAAAQNISTLLDRQRIFLRDTETIPCPHLAFPDAVVQKNRTLRHYLMELTAITMGEERRGAKLFHAITRKVDPKGGEVYQMTYHKSVARESLSIVSGLGQFLNKEMKMDADFYCHPHLIKEGHDWNVKERCVINPTTSYISNLALLSAADEESVEYDKDKDEYSMDTKGKRESKRITGMDDEETVLDLTKKKAKSKMVPQEVEDSRSTVSELSELTKYSSSTKASQERKNLRNQVDEQQEALDAKEAEIEALKAALSRQSIEGNIDADAQSESNSGESTSEDTSTKDQINTPAQESQDPPGTDDSDSDDWGFETNQNVDNQTADVEVLKVVKPTLPTTRSDGLTMIFRGPPKQVQDVADYYTDKGEITVMTPPFKDGLLTMVDLYKVVDKEKFQKAQEIPAHTVKFAETATVKEFDSSGTVQDHPREARIKTPPDPSGESDESNEEPYASGSDSDDGVSASSTSSSNSSSSSSSSIDSITPLKLSPTKRNRPSSVTQDTIAQARKMTQEEMDLDSDGEGPNNDV